MPSDTAIKQMVTFRITFAIPAKNIPDCNWQIVSALNAENVVIEPRKPTANPKYSREFCSTKRLPINRPISKQPRTFTTRVPQGNEFPWAWQTYCVIANRHNAPIAPPIPIIIRISTMFTGCQKFIRMPKNTLSV